MLKKLGVTNFAVIEGLELELSPGLNVFTGETGAGKSILIEALGFLLGARASSSWLRTGADKLTVEGRFAEFAARRELGADGRTKAFVDGKALPIAELAARGEALVDFHGQHEHQALLKPSVQQACLDRFGELDAQAAAVARAYDEWTALKAELEAGQLSEEERKRRLDLASFQLEEIDAAKLKAGEEEELEASLPRLKNGERLRELADAAYGLLYAEEEAASARLAKAERAVSELARLDPSVAAQLEALISARVAVDEAARELGAYRDSVESDPAKLEKTLDRLDLLAKLKKKHGLTVAEVLAKREVLAREVDRLENSDRRAEELEGKLAAAEKDLSNACARLHKERAKAARKLEAALIKELQPLGMQAARFEVAVELEEGRYTRHGADAVEFLIAPNPGEPLKPVRAVASGGELSRVMLALKTVLASADRVPILVFDEVDAGIGGSVGRSVGEKLAALAKKRQILCVTHLPQVACFASSHFHVSKETHGGRTRVRVEKLSGERRLEAVATMLGGRDVTAASRKHAKELLESSLK